MSKKKQYRSMHEIMVARQKLRYESSLYGEKLKNSSDRLLSGFSLSMRNLSFNIRNRLFKYAFIRSLSRSGMLYDFMRNFVRGVRQS